MLISHMFLIVFSSNQKDSKALLQLLTPEVLNELITELRKIETEMKSGKRSTITPGPNLKNLAKSRKLDTLPKVTPQEFQKAIQYLSKISNNYNDNAIEKITS